jgi:hypothetical protein
MSIHANLLQLYQVGIICIGSKFLKQCFRMLLRIILELIFKTYKEILTQNQKGFNQ